MKKLMLLLLSVLCVLIVGCSDFQKEDKADAKEEVKEDKTFNKETIEPEKESNTKSDKKDHLLYSYYWKHEIRGFQVNISQIYLNHSKNEGKQVVKAVFDVESINQSEQDVYKSLRHFSVEDDKGNKGTVEYMPDDLKNEKWYAEAPKMIGLNKKNESSFSVTFDNVDDFNKINALTISFPIQFGLTDDVDSFEQWNEITFKIQ
ncbi:hypothetical protein BCH308197_3668 [Bacillus cereus H3081.97]|uniref:hypothetical protein n=1 Tax=Bacillus cereus group TaxID=86661 RepID=UPI00016B6FF6|nr:MULTISPECIES: hypothetical protein [Bacillus cereus group]EDZ57037.1 hypothetical protein BCH308197_3668 [Bacillus cereus H3081.97]KLA04192.1 hypothetical protein B4086_3536 [Bacillus cereus]KXI69386.1 hypothetical protein ACS51_12660 [Bacillus cereus]MCC2431344.1 hypothetical protein [Bacillus paranthracis]MDX5913865.1 hypothetical protein [Bacillus cereus group sp. BfR-BA-01026]